MRLLEDSTRELVRAIRAGEADRDQLTAQARNAEGELGRIRALPGVTAAGLTDVRTQARVNTPKPVWNPDVPQTINFYEGWQKVPDTQPYPNGFRVQWELFLRHVVGEVKEYPWDLLAGAKGVQMAMAGLQSWEERRWIDLPALEA